MEEPRTDMGRSLDARDFPLPHRDDYYCDPWERPCTFGRWAELYEARHNITFAIDAGVPNPEDERWWRLGYTEIGDDINVSTVWLGMNHRFGEGSPLIYETMVFGGPLDQEQERYSYREEAAAGHERMVRLVRTEIDVTS